MQLSGGMKRRVMIAKALAHDPAILFLDEPTAGVDVELRRDMWEMVRGLRDSGVTIILTTHYIEEAEEMADRVGRDQQGRDHPRGGQGHPHAQARQEAAAHPAADAAGGNSTCACRLCTGACRQRLRSWSITSTPRVKAAALPRCSGNLNEQGIDFQDLHSSESSLEDIFVSLVRARA